jgi:enoyl-CoA hydratase/carnithine racemase
MLTASPLPVKSIIEIASGFATSVDLDGKGRPQRPIHIVDLASPATDTDIAAAAEHARSTLAVTVGVATSPIDQALTALLDALTLTLVPDAVGPTDPVLPRAVVEVSDVSAAVARLAEVAATSPQAAVVTAQVLRQTERLGVRAGLAAEAAAYSMLLGGREFSAWLAGRRLTGRSRTADDTDSEVPVAVHRDGSTLSVRLQRPQRRNAMDWRLREGLVEAISVAVADTAVQVRLSGAGPDFCSGGDLDEFGTAADLVAAYLVRLDRHPGWLLHQVSERVTVQLHGACIGAGIELPAFAVRVIADRSAFFRLPEVSMGLLPGAGGTVSIPRRIGRWRAAWLALSGARLDPQTALEWGLVDEVLGA